MNIGIDHRQVLKWAADFVISIDAYGRDWEAFKDVTLTAMVTRYRDRLRAELAGIAGYTPDAGERASLGRAICACDELLGPAS
jgi:hypothetical protein